jgi:hypothetical protein
MNKELLVQIFVESDENGEGKFATGYPVADNLLITARHVLYPREGQPPKKISVRLYHSETREWKDLDHTNIVWEGGDKYDVALLDCGYIFHGYARLSNHIPRTTDEKWESEGFPDAGRKDNNSKPVAMKGTIYGAAPTQDLFELGVDNPPSEAGLWKGASGSPVFVGNEIVGIIHSYPDNFNGNRLNAIPIQKLMQIPEFMNTINKYNPKKPILKPILQIAFHKKQRTGKQFIFQSWLLPDGNDSQRIEITPNPNKKYVEPLQPIIVEAISKARKELGKNSILNTIEFFVPLEHLNEAFESYRLSKEPDARPIGCTYEVIVRLYPRDGTAEDELRKRWEDIKKKQYELDIPDIRKKKDHTINELVICKSLFDKQEINLQNLIISNAPVIFWVKNKISDVDAIKKINKFECFKNSKKVNQLPDLVLQLRKDFHDNKIPVEHISLLWEDMDRCIPHAKHDIKEQAKNVCNMNDMRS